MKQNALNASENAELQQTSGSLETAELKFINDVPIQNMEESHQRYLLLFCALYGVSIYEASLLTYQDIESDEDGNSTIFIGQKQPRRGVCFPVTKFAKSVLDNLLKGKEFNITDPIFDIEDVESTNEYMNLFMKTFCFDATFSSQLMRNTYKEFVSSASFGDLSNDGVESHYNDVYAYLCCSKRKFIR